MTNKDNTTSERERLIAKHLRRKSNILFAIGTILVVIAIVSAITTKHYLDAIPIGISILVFAYVFWDLGRD